MAEIEFGYWGIRGLGAVFRMLLEYKEAKYKDVQYSDGDAWFKGRKPELLPLNPLANLPYLVDGDTVVCQTNAILFYLGEKFNMNGANAKEKLLNHELLAEIYDVRNGMIDLVYPFKAATRSEEEYTKNALSKLDSPVFAKFEAILEKSGGQYFVSPGAPCVVDFHIWEMLDQHHLLAVKHGKADFLDKFPKCKEFYGRFRALPSLQNYFNSAAYKLPINNPGAKPYFY